MVSPRNVSQHVINGNDLSFVSGATTTASTLISPRIVMPSLTKSWGNTIVKGLMFGEELLRLEKDGIISE